MQTGPRLDQLPEAAPDTWWRLDRNVIILGWVSCLNDIATETIYPLLPLFLVQVLGADKAVIGLIEGVAETTGSLLKLFFGRLADRIGRNKLFAGAGYGVSAAARPFLALVTAPWQVLALRFADKVGKGVRTAPRDALIASSTPPELAGRAFGFHRTLDSVGAVIGPALALGLLPLFHGDYRDVFLCASIPGFLAVLLLVSRVRDRTQAAGTGPAPLSWRGLGTPFLVFALACFIFALGNSSNAFLLLRVNDLGVPQGQIPLVYMCYNLVYAVVSLPAGVLSDRIGRRWLVLAGFLAYAAVYAGFGIATLAWHAWALFAAYGVFSGLTDGLQRAWVADLVPPSLRGSAYGIYHCAVGVAALPASLVGGLIWDRFGAPTMFYIDAALALLAVAVYLASLAVKPGSAPPGPARG